MTDMIKLKYKDIPIRFKRSFSKKYFVEALVVADSGMVEFHQDGEIETYILTLMNIVSIFPTLLTKKLKNLNNTLIFMKSKISHVNNFKLKNIL